MGTREAAKADPQADAADVPTQARAEEDRIELEVYRGPLDLLLYLVRHAEVDILAVPLAEIVGVYLEFLRHRDAFDLDAAGDFLSIAALLIEIKTRALLPPPAEGPEEDCVEDAPHSSLIHRLLEYQRVQAAAAVLAARARDWAARFPRGARQPERASAERPRAGQVDAWDLLRAFERLVRETAPGQARRIVSDETPIQTYIERILSRLAEQPRLSFDELFESGGSREQRVGTLLALLELIREGHVRAAQRELFDPIWITRTSSGATAAFPHPLCTEGPGVRVIEDSVPDARTPIMNNSVS